MSIPEATLKQARHSGFLNLTNKSLNEIPESVWDLNEEMYGKRYYELEKINKVHLDMNSVRSVSKSITKFKDLKAFSAANNQLESLPPELFTMPNLKLIAVAHNNLTTVPSEITSAPQLAKFDASHNKLESFPDIDHDGLNVLLLPSNSLTQVPRIKGSSLTQLDLSSNNISGLPSGFFDLLPALTTLDLSCNKLIALTNDVGNPQSLQDLNLRRNAIATIGSNFAQCKELHHLVISENPMNGLPDCVYQMTGLVTLEASTCGLKDIGEQISNLQKMTTLDVSNNVLRAIPIQVGLVTTLVTVNATGNLIKSIQRAILESPKKLAEQLKQRALEDASSKARQTTTVTAAQNTTTGSGKWDLSKRGLTEVPKCPDPENTVRTVHLGNNKLTSLPDLSGFTQLSELNVSANALTELPQALSGLPLKTLEAARNKLTNVSVLGQLSSLQLLDLSSNMGLNVQGIPFQNLRGSLTTLKLCSLGLTSIPASVFELGELRVLILDGNQLSELPGDRCISSWPKLDELDVSNNNISRLPVELGQVKLRSLGCHGNPLVFPNRSVVNQGTGAILQWLAARATN